MVEQPYACKRHGNAVLVAGHDDMIVADRATSLSNELHATLMGTLDVVAEGEEGIGAEGYLRVLGNPGFLLFHRQHLGLGLEELLPGTVAEYIYTSMVLSRSARRIPSTKGRFITFGCWRSHQMSALLPARRVQWIRLC